MIKRLAMAIAAMVLATVGLTATPAQAAFSDCPNGTSCVWVGYNGTDSRMTISVGANGVGVCHNFPGFVFNNRISSVLDGYGSNLNLYMYSTSNCAGPAALLWVPPTDFGQWSFDNDSGLKQYDNVMSSYVIDHP